VLIEGPSTGYFFDPNLVQVGDQWKLYFGSTGGVNVPGRDGISRVDIDIAADGKLTTSGQSKVVLPEGADRNLVEGAWLQEHAGTYYLFYSDGRFDGFGSDAYELHVARSASPDGPFEKLDRPVLASGNGFRGPGHNSTITDDAGTDWLLYHAYGSDASKGRQLMLDKIDWVDGWPVVNHGVPSDTAMEAPVVDAGTGAGLTR
jgi:arabinan endo-1,5-alpha-L-arabinosidase